MKQLNIRKTPSENLNNPQTSRVGLSFNEEGKLVKIDEVGLVTDIENATPLSKKIIFSIAQSGTQNPIVTVLENDFGVIPLSTRLSVGSYLFQLPGIDLTNRKMLNGKVSRVDSFLYFSAVEFYNDGDEASGILAIDTITGVFSTSSTIADDVLQDQVFGIYLPV